MTDVWALAGLARKALYGISDAWDDSLEPARRASGSHAMGTLIDPPLPIDANTLDVRRTCHVRLAYWSRLVVAGRSLHRLAAADVPALAAFLIVHVDWLTEHHPAAVRELEASAAELGSIAADNAPQRFQVGHCPAPACPGVLRVVLRRDDDLLPSVLACSGTPAHTWPAGQWRLLDRQMHGGPVRDEDAARRFVRVIVGA